MARKKKDNLIRMQTGGGQGWILQATGPRGQLISLQRAAPGTWTPAYPFSVFYKQVSKTTFHSQEGRELFRCVDFSSQFFQVPQEKTSATYLAFIEPFQDHPNASRLG